MHGQAISHNEIYLLIKYIKSILWIVAKRLSYTEDARCLKVNAACTHTAETLAVFISPSRTSFHWGGRRWRLQRNVALSCCGSRYFPKGFMPFSAPVCLVSASRLVMYTGLSPFSCRSIGEYPPPKVFCCYSRAALTQFSILTSTHFLPLHHCTRNSRDLFFFYHSWNHHTHGWAHLPRSTFSVGDSNPNAMI